MILLFPNICNENHWENFNDKIVIAKSYTAILLNIDLRIKLYSIFISRHDLFKPLESLHQD